MRRERLLAGRPHVRLGAAVLRQEQFNCRVCGGDLLAVGGAIATAYRERELTVVRELLAPEGTECRTLAAALGAALGTEAVLLRTSDEAGEPFMAADRPMPKGCLWNLALD